ncbi:hypothetical protein CQA63_09300, partial [Helicobacter marmotae]
MSALETFLKSPYNYEHFRDFIIDTFGENIGIKRQTEMTYSNNEQNIIQSYTQVCEPITLDRLTKLGVYAFKTKSIHAKVGLHKELASILKQNGNLSAFLAVFYEEDKAIGNQAEFRLSLVTAGYDYQAQKQSFSNPRRQSFVLGHEKIKSAKTQLQELIDTKQKDLQSLQKA